MITRSKLLRSLLLVTLTSLVFGCGGGGGSAGSATPPSGKLAQGPVKGAIVFADRVVGGTRFAKDADEVWTTTDDNGNYKLPSVPNYTYVLVSKGGTDTLTGQDAIQLIAQPGAVNITVLTTLLTLDPTCTTKLSEKLQAMQPSKAPLDFDVSTASTPAMLLLIKSVETAVQSITAAVKSNAAATGRTISDQQIADIQFRALQQIASGFSTTTQPLASPAGLRNALETAITSGINLINSDALTPPNTGNISIAVTAAASIADNAVTAATTILGTTLGSTVALPVTSIQSEIALANANPVAFKAAFAAAISASNPMFALVSSQVITSASTPSPYNPANIQIIFAAIPSTITGSAGTGGSGGGTGVGSKPVQ